MPEERLIGGTPYRLLGVYPQPVAMSFEVMLREEGIPAYLEDLTPEARPYAGLEPIGPSVYLWVPKALYARAREVVGELGDAGA